MFTRLIPLVALAMMPMAAAGHDYGRAAAQEFALIMDADRDGLIEADEVSVFGEAVFRSMDVDRDGSLDLVEVRDWEHGLADLATFQGQEGAYAVAIRVVFDVFDRDNDQRVSPEEHAAATRSSAAYADIDADGAMSYAEYCDGFVYNVVMRTALTH